MVIIIVYFWFSFFYSWGCHLSYNMFSISRIFIQKKKAIQPGNVKDEVVLIQKLNESKAVFKEQLRLQSKKIIAKESRQNLLKISSRQMALANRNIGNHSMPTSKRDVFSIRENMRSFRPGRGGLDPFSGTIDSTRVPVSKRKNDVLIISARDFGNVTSKSNVDRFNLLNYDEQMLDGNFDEGTDPNKTDDEKNVDDYYNFQVIEEEGQEDELRESKRRIRKHTFLEELKTSRKNSSKLILDGLNAKTSLTSEYYRTPRNVDRIRDEDFLRYSPKDELNSIQEIVNKIPKIPSKKDIHQSLSSKKVNIERSFKFDFNTDDEGSQVAQSKTSESLRKLQKNIKMEFLEEIKFGSSIFQKSNTNGDKVQDLVEKSSKLVKECSPLKSEIASEIGELFKKKQMGSKDLDNLDLNLSPKRE